MWANSSIFYQIYPLGFCGAPKDNDGITINRIKKVIDWTDYLSELGIDAVLFNPVFESDRHGYDTRDYAKIDCRLGTNEDFANVCQNLHEHGIRIILDGVFNHVGRGFWAFQDVLRNRENSIYKDWFHIQFGQDNGYQDGLYYEGWEGHYELVKLNLKNREVIDYLLGSVRRWVEEFDIDGLRLDVAYCLEHDFLKELRAFCHGLKQDFFIVGESLFGDYRQITNDTMMHSCTNYECYKGIYSSFNDMNMFEISYSLNRQYGAGGGIYQGLQLLSFVDNHDVSRIASILTNKNHLPLSYAMLLSMPGIPCIYYGSEWGITGKKEDGDDSLRPCQDTPVKNHLTEFTANLISIRKSSKALCYGDYKNIVITNKQLIFERYFEEERIWVAINIDSTPYTPQLDSGVGTALDLITNMDIQLNTNCTLSPYSVSIWKMHSIK